MGHIRRSTARLTTIALVASSLVAAGGALAIASEPSPLDGPSSLSATNLTPDDALRYSPASTPPAAVSVGPRALLRSALPDTVAAAAPATVHSLDVVVVDPTSTVKSTATDADIQSLVQDVSNYWSAQTNGKVSFQIKDDKVLHLTPKAGTPACGKSDGSGLTSLWTQASELVTANANGGPQDWWAGGDPKVGPPAREHLVVLYPYGSTDEDGTTTCSGTLGLGTTPTSASVTQNGLTFALYGGRIATTVSRGSDPQFYQSRQTLAHELGHNFGLEHSGTWWCDSGASDGAFTSSACGMLSYLDPFDPMGASFGDKGVPPLSGPQKLRLGVLGSGQHQTVTATSKVRLAPVPASEIGALTKATITAPAVQVAQVKDPSTGDTYDVEYRPGPQIPGVTFPDAGVPWGTYGFEDSSDLYTLGFGVRILRLAPSTTSAWDKNEESIVPIGSASHRTSYLASGKAFTTRSGKVTIKVTGENTTTASIVFTVHKKPSLTLRRSATSQRHDQTAARITATAGSVDGRHATGTVAFKDGSKTLKTVRTSSTGVAAYTLPKSLSVKTHTITAGFTPDAASKTRGVDPTSAKTTVKVTKATSSLSLKLRHTTVAKGAKPNATITVHVAGIAKPTGTVKIYENGHKVKTVKLSASKKGKVSVTLPKTTKRGTVKVVAKYSGTMSIASKTSKTAKLHVH